MSWKTEFIQGPGYLHVIVTGENTKDNVYGYLEEALNECITRHCSRVLIEERLEGPRLKTLEVFDIAATETEQARGKVGPIAFVDVNATGELTRFAENVAVNRGLNVSMFSTVADAETWLRQQDSKSVKRPSEKATKSSK